MNIKQSIRLIAASCFVVSGLASTATVAAVQVGQFGDYGWRSDDTRDASGANLVGINNTNAGKPGQPPTAADDAAIASQIQFVPGPAGSTYGGAVSIDGTSSNSGKSNISVIDPVNGYGTGASLLTTFAAQYEWYGQPNPTSRTLAFKLGIQSTSWGSGVGQSQNGFTATRSGESVWDLVLVHVPAASDNAWSTVNIDHDSGGWVVFRQAGNAFFPAPPNMTDANGRGTMTLDDWALDPTFGPQLFGPTAKITSVQFGLGSSQRNSISYLDYLQTNLLNGGDVINFVATVPEPASFVLLGIAAAGLGMHRRRRG